MLNINTLLSLVVVLLICLSFLVGGISGHLMNSNDDSQSQSPKNTLANDDDFDQIPEKYVAQQPSKINQKEAPTQPVVEKKSKIADQERSQLNSLKDDILKLIKTENATIKKELNQLNAEINSTKKATARLEEENNKKKKNESLDQLIEEKAPMIKPAEVVQTTKPTEPKVEAPKPMDLNPKNIVKSLPNQNKRVVNQNNLLDDRNMSARLDNRGVLLGADDINRFAEDLNSSVTLGSEGGGNFVSLKKVVDILLDAHPEIMQKEKETESDRIGIEVAEAGKWPTIDLALRYGQEDTWGDNVARNKKHHSKSRHNISFKYNLIDFGFNEAEILRNSQKYLSSLSELTRLKQDVALQTIFAYIETLKHKEIMDLIAQHAGTVNEILNLTNESLNAGISNLSELKLLETSLDKIKINHLAAFNNFEDSRATFKSKVFFLPPLNFDPLQFFPEIDTKYFSGHPFDDVISIAKKNHPTLIAASYDIDEARAKLEASVAKSMPTINFEVDAYSNRNEYYGGANAFDRDYSTAMLVMNYNVFDGGKTRKEEEQARVELSSIEDLYQRRVLEVEESVRLSWNAYRTLDKQTDFFKSQLASAKISVDTAIQQYNLNQGSLMDIYEKQTILHETQRNFTMAYCDLIYSYFRVLHATGALLEPFDGRSKPSAIN